MSRSSRSNRRIYKGLLLARAGRDPVTGKPLKKGVTASEAMTRWRLNFAKKHGFLPRTGPPPKPSAPKVNSFGYTDRQWARFSPARRQQIMARVKHQQHIATTGGGRGGGGLTPTQRRSMKGQYGHIQDIQGFVNSARDKSGKPLRNYTKAGILNVLRSKNYPEWAIKAATSIRDHGYVLPGIQQTMRNVGINPNIVLPRKYRRVPPNRRPRATRAQRRSGATRIPGLGGIL
jgi:hypothetical protein